MQMGSDISTSVAVLRAGNMQVIIIRKQNQNKFAKDVIAML